MKVVGRNDTYSLGASFNGAAFGLDHIVGYAISGEYTTANAEGTIKLQASNDPFSPATGDPNNFNPTGPNAGENPNATWDDISGATEVVSSTSGVFFFNVSDVYYRGFRVVWTRASGTGTLVTQIWGKGFV